MYFIPENRSIGQILQAVANCGYDLVVELTSLRKEALLPGFQIEEGAVIGRSSKLNPITIPTDMIRDILRINGENVQRKNSPFPERRAPIYPGDDQVFLDSPRLALSIQA